MNCPRQPTTSLRAEARALVTSCPGWNSRVAQRRITHVLDRDLEPLGLSAAQVGLLAMIATEADDRLGALALRAGLDPSTLSRNLRVLETLGLVEIASIEKDQRRRAVWLTELGVRRLAAALPVWRQAQARLARRLPGDPASSLARATEVLIEAE
jgi:DNA-binding MarR family transcriptional regulator